MQDHDHDDDSATGDDAGASLPTATQEPAPTPFYVSRQDIADADDISEEDVRVPEWAPKNATQAQRAAAVVRVRGLTGTQRDEFEASIITEKADPTKKGRTVTKVDTTKMRAKLVVKSVVHPPESPQAGQPMFDDTDIGWISAKGAAALDRVFSVAQRLSGLSDDDVEALVEGFGAAGTSNGEGSTSS